MLCAQVEPQQIYWEPLCKDAIIDRQWTATLVSVLRDEFHAIALGGGGAVEPGTGST